MEKFRHGRDSVSALQIGDRVQLGRTPYTIMQTARGGMGLVLMLDRDPNHHDHFSFAVHRLRMAVKTVLPEFLDDEAALLFRRELTIWAGFEHPHIVRLSEILDADADGWVAAMPWCEGSLVDILKNHPTLKIKEATQILLDVVDGLAYAFSSSRTLHLDIKPGNILYDPSFDQSDKYPDESVLRKNYLVSDWGLASIKEPRLRRVAGLPPSHPNALQTFNNLGTVLYMAPERFVTGYKSSVASDVFSLGLIYFQLLFGHLPYGRDLHPVAQLTTHQYYDVARHVLTASSVTSRVKNLLLRMLHPTVETRYREYDELRSDLKRLLRPTPFGVNWP